VNFKEFLQLQAQKNFWFIIINFGESDDEVITYELKPVSKISAEQIKLIKKSENVDLSPGRDMDIEKYVQKAYEYFPSDRVNFKRVLILMGSEKSLKQTLKNLKSVYPRLEPVLDPETEKAFRGFTNIL